eukprot:COSAG06_NODE_35324_length_461_cov_1.143646_2_plen_30_part_01
MLTSIMHDILVLCCCATFAPFLPSFLCAVY